MKESVKVLLADEHPVARAGLRTLLSHEPSISVVGEAATGAEALQKTVELEPHVVLLDIRLPRMDGIETTRRIKEWRPATAVVLMTMHDNDVYIQEALRAGATGYLVKDASPQLIYHTITAVREGGILIHSPLLRQALQSLPRPLQQDVQHTQQNPLSIEQLTRRERDVLHLLAQGYSNKRLCQTLMLAEATVKKHVQNTIAKMGASDRTHAAILAVRLGLAD